MPTKIFKDYKKLGIIGLVFVLLITAVVAVFLFPSESKDGALKLDQSDQSSQERYSTSTTGIELIQKALDEKKIDSETALIYKVKFLFNDPTLPREYFTENAPFEDSGVFMDIKANWDKLSEQTKKTLEPYFKRPDDPESYISQVLNGEIAQSSVGHFQFIKEALARDRPISYKSEDILNTADGKIKVWYAEKKEMVDGKEKITKLYYETAKRIVANLNTDGAYGQFVGLLGKVPPSDGVLGGDGKTDIYVVPTGYSLLLDNKGRSSLGVNAPDNGNVYSSFILIRENLDQDHLKTTTVHELFHGFQRAFPWCWQTGADLWWIEGTATWSEDFIYPNLNTEQGYVESFIPKPEFSLNKKDDNFEYGAYLFPFYLTKTYDNSLVAKIFEGCSASVVPLQAAENIIDGGFKKNWKEFTLWNYNKKPVAKYKEKDKSGKFTNHSSQSGGNADMTFVSGIGEIPIKTKDLSFLTAQAFELPINDESKEIRRVVFRDLKNFTSKSEKASIKAVIYPVTGDPYIEDWTDKSSRSFCFDKSDEHFEKVILIFGNADIKNKISSADLKLKTDTSCYGIEQGESMVSKPIFALRPEYVGKVVYSAEGSLVKDSVPASAKQPYLGKWKVNVKYDEHWPMQSFMGIVSSAQDYNYDHVLEFDLTAESVEKDGTFEIQTQKGNFKSKGITIDNQISGDSVKVPAGTQGFDLSGKQKGVIYDMTENGAKIKLPDYVLYNNGGYRDLPHPIILEISSN